MSAKDRNTKIVFEFVKLEAALISILASFASNKLEERHEARCKVLVDVEQGWKKTN